MHGRPLPSSLRTGSQISPHLGHIRDLKIRRQRRRRERQKSNRFSNQNNNFARASRFFVHFFAVTARLRRENAQFHVVLRKHTRDDEIFSLSLNLDMFLGIQLYESSPTFDKVSDLE